MAKQSLGFVLFLVALVILMISGNLGIIPLLLPFAAVSAYLTVRAANRHRVLLLHRKRR
jgi:hypothetical protein